MTGGASARHEGADFTALSDRMTYLLVLRAALSGIVLAWSAIRPEALGTPFIGLVGATAVFLFTATVLEWGRRRVGGLGHVVLSILLLVDGLYLAFAMYATGGTESPIRFLIYLHLVAVSLLASYRTGLKVALWHSLLLFVVLYAQAAALLPAVDVEPGRSVAFDSLPVLNVTSFWLFALATSVFSAMNERELRQRRRDLQALVDLGSRLDEVGDPVHQGRIVLEGLAERFGITRGLVLGASDGQLVTLASQGAEPMPTAPVVPDAIVRRAWQRREPLAVRRLDPIANPLLAGSLPGARNLLVAPMAADGRTVGAIVVEYRSRPIFGVERRVVSVVSQFAAVASLNLRNAALLRHVQDLAERDSLTGAANRRMFQVTLERVLAEEGGPAKEGHVTAVLFIDLDDFKVVNDTFGHAAGDELLVAVTDRIGGLVRQSDLVARLGGDEFAILTDDGPDLERARAMAERLVRDLRQPYQIGQRSVIVSASIGIASAREANQDAAEVVRNADVAMYMAKANGKSGFAIFDPGMHAAIRDRHELGADLQRAVELDQLRLVYQPIIELATGRISGIEALVRWQHPERGIVAPGEFIEIAEENGAILSIGQWVLRQACEQVVSWRAAGIVPPELSLCVNVSAREVQQAGFVSALTETLAWAGFPAGGLALEITETALLKATPPTIETLVALQRLGVKILIDDFGTGYFSLSHLRQFPVDGLKIAREFVHVADADTRSAALAGAVVALGRSLDITAIAEGIETAEQAERMRSFGCAFGQGFHFAPPLEPADVETAMARLNGSVEAPRQPARRTRPQPASA